VDQRFGLRKSFSPKRCSANTKPEKGKVIDGKILAEKENK